MALEQDDIDRIAEKLSVCLIESRKARWVDPDTHAAHHEWAAVKMSSEAEWRAMRLRVIESAAIWAIPIIIGFVATAIWHESIARIIKAMAGAGQ